MKTKFEAKELLIRLGRLQDNNNGAVRILMGETKDVVIKIDTKDTLYQYYITKNGQPLNGVEYDALMSSLYILERKYGIKTNVIIDIINKYYVMRAEKTVYYNPIFNEVRIKDDSLSLHEGVIDDYMFVVSVIDNGRETDIEDVEIFEKFVKEEYDLNISLFNRLCLDILGRYNINDTSAFIDTRQALKHLLFRNDLLPLSYYEENIKSHRSLIVCEEELSEESYDEVKEMETHKDLYIIAQKINETIPADIRTDSGEDYTRIVVENNELCILEIKEDDTIVGIPVFAQDPTIINKTITMIKILLHANDGSTRRGDALMKILNGLADLYDSYDLKPESIDIDNIDKEYMDSLIKLMSISYGNR